MRRAAGWSDPAFERVAEVVHLVAGLVFPPNRQPSAESGMRRAMTALRISDPGTLAKAVQRAGEPRDTVLAELTVGETYFFRETSQLDVLRTHVLPGLLERRGPAAPLRVWSAGCASGEEPYTLAILLRELGWPHPARIIGTDVARPRLDAARRGRYTRWSLRGVSSERVERWFEARAAHFQLDAEIRDAVEFSQLNLIADDYPSAATGTMDQDVVLCRNVLIYFDMASVERIATRLLASLAPDGWLLLGASDPPLAGLVPCEMIMLPGGVVYRRADHAPPRAAHGFTLSSSTTTKTDTLWAGSPGPEPWLPWSFAEATEQAFTPTPASPAQQVPLRTQAPEPAAPAGSALEAYASADYTRTEALAGADVATDPSRVDSWTLLVRAIANQGRLRDAEQACVRALDLHRLSPELHYLHATLLGAALQHRESANAARRALYLDRRFVMAHLLLGDALARLGDVERARQAFGNVIADLAEAPDDARLPAADGVPVARLRQVAELRLRGLRDGEGA